MKKLFSIIIVALAIGLMLQGCGSQNEVVNNPQPVESVKVTTPENKVTKEMAYEGVNNYCHSEYDWSVAEDNPSMMYVEMGEETEKEYQVVFHSYTGTVVYFNVDKLTGTTKMVEYVPTLDIENEAGEINLLEYIN